MCDADPNKWKRNMDLDLLEERRILCRLRSKSLEEKVKKTHDKKIFKRPIKVGGWVLQKIEGTTRHIKANN